MLLSSWDGFRDWGTVALGEGRPQHQGGSWQVEIRGQRSGLGATSAQSLRQEQAGMSSLRIIFLFLSSPAFINFLLLFLLVISLICSLPHRIKKSHGQIRAIGWKGARDNSGADLGQRWNPGPRFHTFDRASKCRTCCQDSSETC